MDVLREVVGLFACGADLLQVEVGHHHSHRRSQHGRDDHHGDDTEQQDGEGVVVIVDLVFEGDGVKDHLHLDGAQGAELGQVGHARHGQVIKPQSLHQGDQQRLDELAVADVAQAPDHKGQLGEDVAVRKGMAEPLEEVWLLAACTQRRLNEHGLCHKDRSSLQGFVSPRPQAGRCRVCLLPRMGSAGGAQGRRRELAGEITGPPAR